MSFHIPTLDSLLSPRAISSSSLSPSPFSTAPHSAEQDENGSRKKDNISLTEQQKSAEEGEEGKENSVMILLKEISEAVKVANQIEGGDEYTVRTYSPEAQSLIEKANNLSFSMIKGIIQFAFPPPPPKPSSGSSINSQTNNNRENIKKYGNLFYEEEDDDDGSYSKDVSNMTCATDMNELYEKTETCVDAFIDGVELCIKKKNIFEKPGSEHPTTAQKGKNKDNVNSQYNHAGSSAKHKSSPTRNKEEKGKETEEQKQEKEMFNPTAQMAMKESKKYSNYFYEADMNENINYEKVSEEKQNALNIIRLDEKPQRHFLHLVDNFNDVFVTRLLYKDYAVKPLHPSIIQKQAACKMRNEICIDDDDCKSSEEQNEEEEKEVDEGEAVEDEEGKNASKNEFDETNSILSSHISSLGEIPSSPSLAERNHDGNINNDYHSDSNSCNFYIQNSDIKVYMQKHKCKKKSSSSLPHPYEFEIKSVNWFRNNSKMLSLREPDKNVVASLSKTFVTLVEDKQQLREMISELNNGLNTEIAMDVEHHSTHSYRGFVCLIQISTREKDWLVDPFMIFDELHALNQITANPNILKVFHGADNDVLWLQRDFSIYLVNMFDTFQAAKELEVAGGFSLKNLLKVYCDVTTNKKFQMADWRIRPLTEDMKTYARIDTRYLLYIYDILKNQLLCKPEIGGYKATPLGIEKTLQITDHGYKALRNVMERSKAICLKVYTHKQFDAFEVALSLLQNISQNLTYTNNHRQSGYRQPRPTTFPDIQPLNLITLVNILKWRDHKCRVMDESPAFVLNNLHAVRIAQQNIRSIAELQNSIRPLPVYVRKFAHKIVQIIEDSRKEADALSSSSSSSFYELYFETKGEKEIDESQEQKIKNKIIKKKAEKEAEEQTEETENKKQTDKNEERITEKNTPQKNLTENIIKIIAEEVAEKETEKLPQEKKENDNKKEKIEISIDATDDGDKNAGLAKEEEKINKRERSPAHTCIEEDNKKKQFSASRKHEKIAKESAKNRSKIFVEICFEGKKICPNDSEGLKRNIKLEDALFTKNDDNKEMDAKKRKSLSLCYSIHSSLKNKIFFNFAFPPSNEIQRSKRRLHHVAGDKETQTAKRHENTKEELEEEETKTGIEEDRKNDEKVEEGNDIKNEKQGALKFFDTSLIINQQKWCTPSLQSKRKRKKKNKSPANKTENALQNDDNSNERNKEEIEEQEKKIQEEEEKEEENKIKCKNNFELLSTCWKTGEEESTFAKRRKKQRSTQRDVIDVIDSTNDDNNRTKESSADASSAQQLTEEGKEKGKEQEVSSVLTTSPSPMSSSSLPPHSTDSSLSNSSSAASFFSGPSKVSKSLSSFSSYCSPSALEEAGKAGEGVFSFLPSCSSFSRNSAPIMPRTPSDISKKGPGMNSGHNNNNNNNRNNYSKGGRSGSSSNLRSNANDNGGGGGGGGRNNNNSFDNFNFLNRDKNKKGKRRR